MVNNTIVFNAKLSFKEKIKILFKPFLIFNLEFIVSGTIDSVNLSINNKSIISQKWIRMTEMTEFNSFDIQDVNVWPRALTEEEILKFYSKDE